ncbi:dihydrodipicolinate synthase family protein [Planctomycetota bacterium]|nr:dihydrodipicolinate synthase family protein [Planctomycetota bacterium]
MYLPAGAFAPIPTPINAKGNFESDAQAQHMRWLQTEGLAGVLVLGSNGEFPSFSTQERKAIAEAASEAKGELDLILNVGSCALPDVLELAEHANDVGYSAILCPPPFYFKGITDSGLAAFFRQVLDASPLPVFLYHIPQFTGVNLSDDFLTDLCEHPNFAGLKDSTGDTTEMTRLLKHCKGRSYLVGNDKLIAASYAAGGQGSISAAASVVPDLVASVGSDHDQQTKLTSLRGILDKFGLGPSVKAILQQKGFGEYATRPPLEPLEDAQADQLIAMLNMFGAIKW